MKLKSFIGTCIACTAIALMAVSAHAEQYAIGGASGTVDGSGKSEVDVPVMVIPGKGETAHVNGYIMTLTYDSTKVHPEKGTDANSPYAEKGAKFNDGIIVSDVVDSADSKNGDKTLIVAWASANPVAVAENAQPADETMAVIKFAITDEVDADVPVHVELAQLANDSSTVKTGDQVIDQVVQGDINLGKDTGIIYGDIDNDGEPSTYDASLALQYATKVITLTPEQITRGNVDGDEDVTTYDASLIAQYATKIIQSFPVENK